ncbi:MAG TPA: FecR domain-containing protein [Caulobacteraceae bacterium]|nr:FecR domain-containing protein [Caulobacteraceae bacterium]
MSAALKIEEQAAAWLARRDAGDWSAEDQAALDAWIAQDTAHRVAFLRLDSVWSRADRMAALKGAEPSFGPAAWRRPQVRIAAGLAAAAVLGAGLLGVNLAIPGRAYTTDVGGHATVPLADGSRVELNTNTKLRAEIAESRRAVWLDRGEAYFEVAHDPARPFVVHAGARRITVLGTKFLVRREGKSVEVAVVEGKVRVDPVQQERAKPAVLTRGELAVAKGEATLVAARSVEKVENELSWREGMLVFDRSTLTDAVAEFNRYNRKKLVIAGEVAGEVRIGGSFEADNIDAFARLLEQAFGLSVEDRGEEIVIGG